MMTRILTLAVCLGLMVAPRARAQAPEGQAPTWPQVAHVIMAVDAAGSLAGIQQVLQANAAIVQHAGTESLLAGMLRNGRLDQPQTVMLTLAHETVRDARAGGIPLAAATLGVRMTIVQLLGAQSDADVRTILLQRRDITSSPRLGDAFARIGQQPGVSAPAMREIAAAFREANTSVDAAVARLIRLATSGAGGGGGTAAGAPATGPAAGLVGHWRSTTSRGGGADLSMTTDHHMVLNGNGTFRAWSHSVTVTSFGGSEDTTPEERGTWTLSGSTLVLQQASGRAEYPFRRSGTTIVLSNDRERRVWEKID